MLVPWKGHGSEVRMSVNVRRPPSHVQAERLKGGGRLLSAFPTGQRAPFGKGLREHAKKHHTSSGGGRSAAEACRGQISPLKALPGLRRPKRRGGVRPSPG